MSKYQNYIKLLVDSLIDYYNFSNEEAIKAVKNSAVYKMLEDDATAKWQMHQPLRSTVEEIYDEYEGIFA